MSSLNKEIVKAIMDENISYLTENKDLVFGNRTYGNISLKNLKWKVIGTFLEWYIEKPIRDVIESKIPLVVVTACYVNHNKRIEYLETMRESFSRFESLDVQFLLASSGDVMENYSHNTWWTENKTPQFIAIQQMFRKLGRNYLPENAIVMVCDDDDTLLYPPKCLEKMYENTHIDGIKSVQAIPLTKEKCFFQVKTESLEDIDSLSNIFEKTNDLSGYTCRWGLFYDFLIHEEIKGHILVQNMFDTKFMMFVDNLNVVEPNEPYIFRRPSTGCWTS